MFFFYYYQIIYQPLNFILLFNMYIQNVVTNGASHWVYLCNLE